MGRFFLTGIRGYVKCSSRCTDIYIDGLQMGSTYSTWTSVVSRKSTLIAVRAINQSREKYIVASFSRGQFKTSSKWRCSAHEEAGWTSLTFNDSHWQNADVVGTETDTSLQGADQIWLGSVGQEVRCRGWLGTYELGFNF